MNESSRNKPLGGRAYGSIPHLPGSRLGPGDWSIHEGQARIATEKARDKRDRIIVTEKLDGSCCTIARIGDDIVPITRAGYHAATSPFEQHHHFARYVEERRDIYLATLSDGERLCGEWLLQAHGTRYAIASEDHLFVIFDIMAGKKRLPHDEVRARLRKQHVAAAVISDGPPLSTEAAMAALSLYGEHGAEDPVEGAVWRVERDGRCDFLCKFVRHDKRDGCYLPELTGAAAIWNLAPERAARRVGA